MNNIYNEGYDPTQDTNEELAEVVAMVAPMSAPTDRELLVVSLVRGEQWSRKWALEGNSYGKAFPLSVADTRIAARQDSY